MATSLKRQQRPQRPPHCYVSTQCDHAGEAGGQRGQAMGAGGHIKRDRDLITIPTGVFPSDILAESDGGYTGDTLVLH